jgi:hypothetical protein
MDNPNLQPKKSHVGLIAGIIAFIVLICAVIIFYVWDPAELFCKKPQKTCKKPGDCCGEDSKCIEKKCCLDLGNTCKNSTECCNKNICDDKDKKCVKPPLSPTPGPSGPSGPTPPTPKECVGNPMGTFCEDEPETRKCWPHCPDPSQWGKPAVYNCGNKYDKTSGKQCKYGWGKNYRIGGESEAFGCLSGDSCKVLTPTPPPPGPSPPSVKTEWNCGTCPYGTAKCPVGCEQEIIDGCSIFGNKYKCTCPSIIDKNSCIG